MLFCFRQKSPLCSLLLTVSLSAHGPVFEPRHDHEVLQLTLLPELGLPPFPWLLWWLPKHDDRIHSLPIATTHYHRRGQASLEPEMDPLCIFFSSLVLGFGQRRLVAHS